MLYFAHVEVQDTLVLVSLVASQSLYPSLAAGRCGPVLTVQVDVVSHARVSSLQKDRVVLLWLPDGADGHPMHKSWMRNLAAIEV